MLVHKNKNKQLVTPYPTRRQPKLSRDSSSYSLYAGRSNLYRSQVLPGQLKDKGRVKHWRLNRSLIVVVLVGLLGAHLLWSAHASAEATAARQAHTAAILAAKRAAVFRGQMVDILAANPGITMSVTTISQTDGLQRFGAAEPFDGASTGKLITAADFLHHVEQHTTSLHQNIDGSSAEEQLRVMLVDSDDTAWANLNDYLGHADLQQYASSVGINGYDPDDNTFSGNDMGLLLERLYDKQLLNNADRSLMLSYMAQANYRSFIVPAAPVGDMVYHKVGEDGDNVHDAAIITNGQHHLVLVIFTNGNGSYDWGDRAQLIQLITRDAVEAYL